MNDLSGAYSAWQSTGDRRVLPEMKTSLDHLPAPKQRDLDRVVQIIFEEFADALAVSTSDWKKRGRIDKIILYGSYARGGWVDEPHTAKGYQSDFDLLIIVSDKRLTDRAAYWSKLDERLIREFAITKTIHVPVNYILHTLQEVNDGLAHGRYFFMDVKRDGVVVYQADQTELHEPKPKTPQQALAMAKGYFDEWYPAAMRKNKLARDAVAQEFNKEAAFLLHQTVETLYHCVLLVCTFYTPHVHNLAFLRSQAELIDRRLIDAWPREVRRERGMFEKLKEAYVKARYSAHYKISSEELAWLGGCVEELGQIVMTVCNERIAELEKAV
jgi:predicted nucleotidyltransferase/HEPN domain-containing protein